MARKCELSGKGPQVGYNVSHANNKTKRRFLPNLQQIELFSDALQQYFKFRACVHALRSVEHAGGLDAYLLKNKTESLPTPAQAVKLKVRKKQQAAVAA